MALGCTIEEDASDLWDAAYYATRLRGGQDGVLCL